MKSFQDIVAEKLIIQPMNKFVVIQLSMLKLC